MKIKKINILDEGGSCNFCKIGKLSLHGSSIVYPYNEVLELKTDAPGGGLTAQCCYSCAKQLAEYISKNIEFA